MDKSDFLQLIQEHPFDLDARLSYADWLSERGAPQGEFIRTQCQMDKVREEYFEWDCDGFSRYSTYGLERELQEFGCQLLRQHREEWTLPFRGVGKSTFRLGLPQAISLTAADLWNHGETILPAGPILELKLREVPSLLDRLDSFSPLQQIRRLDLSNSSCQNSHVRRLLKSKYLSQLHWLRLLPTGGSKLSFDHLPAQLGCLDLSQSTQLTEYISEFANWPGLSSLHSLSLAHSSLNDEAATTLAASPHLSQLQHLNLKGNLFGSAGFRALLESDTFPRLTHFSASTWLQARDIKLLQNSPMGQTLEWTDLRLGSSAAREVVGSPLLTTLRSLSLLGRMEKADDVIIELSQSEHAFALQRLFLQNKQLGDKTWDRLFRSDKLTGLRHLELTQCNLRNRHAAMLSEWPVAANLEVLVLTDTAMGPQGLDRLFANPFPKLRKLDLTNTGFGSEALLRRISSKLPRLEFLYPVID